MLFIVQLAARLEQPPEVIDACVRLSKDDAARCLKCNQRVRCLTLNFLIVLLQLTLVPIYSTEAPLKHLTSESVACLQRVVLEHNKKQQRVHLVREKGAFRNVHSHSAQNDCIVESEDFRQRDCKERFEQVIKEVKKLGKNVAALLSPDELYAQMREWSEPDALFWLQSTFVYL